MKKFSTWTLVLLAAASLVWSSSGCQKRSAQIVFPEYLKKKQDEKCSADTGKAAQAHGTPLQFFPGQSSE